MTAPSAGSTAATGSAATGSAQRKTTGAARSSGAAVPTGTGASGAPGKLASGTMKALTTALNCENAAVWAYGLVAAYDTGDLSDINDIEAGHLARRDATAERVKAGGGRSALPAPAYKVPAPVTDLASARALGGVVETDCAAAWRAVIASTDDNTLRAVALSGLSDSAVWLTTLKLAAKAPVPTVPFPGQS